jgi:hypothetical protein
MVVARALRATGCSSCRLFLLRSFTSLAAPATLAPHISARLRRPPGPATRFRYSSHLARSNQEVEEGRGNDTEASRIEDEEIERRIEEELGEEWDEASETHDDSEVSAIPWYLQVKSPQREVQPLSERQKIPELPVAPPPILEPLLQQVSIDLGMDDLSLLDLRKLDPPPALGANLLMIIGTARSERHLHVSADRLCRWLRSTYRLRPDADGLLGRNELKLKLKRKAKRAKLMGSAADETGDDGVRTGWVCVDIGVVEPSEEAAEAPQREDFVGFGRRVDGVRIVVQLLTEEKREEIDLEKLWGGILKRGGQPPVETVEETQEPQIPSSESRHYGTSSIEGPSSVPGQRRLMHTSSRRLSQTQQTSTKLSSSLPSESSSGTPFENFDLNAIQESVLSDLNSGSFEKAKNDLIGYSHFVPALKDGGWRNVLLTLLRVHIQSVPTAQALAELSLAQEESNRSPFMGCFRDALSFYPTQFGAESEIWLHGFARDIAHPDYTLHELRSFLKKLQGYCVPISRDSYMVLIRSVLLPRKSLEVKPASSHDVADTVLEILRVMQDQGLQILDEDMLVELQELTEPPSSHQHRKQHDDASTYGLDAQMPTPIQRRLHLLMMKLPLPLFSDESRIRLLNIHARNDFWVEFWDVFRMAPRACASQSAAVYAYMFACVANTGSQKGCMTVLRNWVSDMNREEPPVRLEGDVAEAVKACLRVADPNIEMDAAEGSELKGEWVDLWRRCQ